MVPQDSKKDEPRSKKADWLALLSIITNVSRIIVELIVK